MKQEDVTKIERELCLSLPLSYKVLVINHPLVPQEMFQAVKNSLLNNPDDIIDLNSRIRREGFRNKKWPPNFYIFGRRGDTNFYFIDVTQGQNEIIYFAQDDEKFNPKAIGNLRLDHSFERFINHQQSLQQIFNERKGA